MPPGVRSPRVKISLELSGPDPPFYSNAMISLGFHTNFLPFSPDTGVAMGFQLKKKAFYQFCQGLVTAGREVKGRFN